MMARSKCSNQRPDTLMQDRSPPARRNHLQRAAGPYMWVKLRSGAAFVKSPFDLTQRTGQKNHDKGKQGDPRRSRRLYHTQIRGATAQQTGVAALEQRRQYAACLLIAVLSIC